MPKLYEITDAYSGGDLPAEETVLPTDRPRVIINTAEFDKPKLDWDKGVEAYNSGVGDLKSKASGIADAIKYASELDQKFTSSVLNFPKKAYENSDDLVKGLKNLFGFGEGERYQLWPEKVAREALTSVGDIAKPNPYPEGSEQYYEYEGKRQEGMVPAAMAISALAGSGGLGGTGAKAGEVALGATPFLRPALKHKEKLYKGKPGQEHQDIIPKELYEDFRQKAMSGEDLAEYNFGFINDKGHFLDREKALKYGIDTGIIDPYSGRFGALTTTLMADSSKPGTAIEAMAKSANPFYSAVEHTVKNISQSKMTGDQWLGTLSNKPGVKPEEMDWTGLKAFLEENKGKLVTKDAIQEHLASNKVELKEVSKGTGELKKAAEDLQAAVGNEKITVANHRDKLYADEVEQGLWSGDITPKDLPTNLQPYAEKMLSLRYQQENPTKYHSYQLPGGGENYREMLLTLPNKKSARIDELDDQIAELYARKPRGSANFATAEDNRLFGDLSAERNKLIKQENSYKSSHWDEPNILAHVRMNDRTIDDKKSLHLEEIQSDWHQQGRDKGYQSKNNKRTEEELAKEIYENFGRTGGGQTWEQLAPTTRNEYLERARAQPELMQKGGVPDAPFKKSWHELALKRMLREAAEKGYDRLSWTPGEAQAARYDLSKQVNLLSAMGPDKNGKYLVYMEGKDKQPLFRNRDGFSEHGQKTMDASELEATVGKETAKRLMEGAAKNKNNEKTNGFFDLKDEGLKIGGEGMRGFYDQIIPKALEKLGKEHGVKVKKDYIANKEKEWPFSIRIASDGKKYWLEGKDPRLDHSREVSLSKKFDSYDAADTLRERFYKGETEPVFYIDIPKSLKDTAIHKGFPLFSSTPGYMFVPFEGDPFKDLK